MFQNVYNNSPLHLEIPISWLKWTIVGARKVTFSTKENACISVVKFKYIPHLTLQLFNP